MVIYQTANKIRLFGSLLFLVMFTTLIMIADTIYLEPPFKEEMSAVEISPDKLTLRLRFSKLSNNAVRLESELITPAETVYLSSSLLRTEEFTRVYAIIAPPNSCVRTTMSYQYRLSLREHSRTLSLVCS